MRSHKNSTKESSSLLVKFKSVSKLPPPCLWVAHISSLIFYILWNRSFLGLPVSESQCSTLYSGCSVRQKMILSVFRNLQIFLFHLTSNLSHLFQLQLTIIMIFQSCISTLSGVAQLNMYQQHPTSVRCEYYVHFWRDVLDHNQT